MWPFGRKQDTSAPAEPARQLPQVRFEWKSVPSLQRTVGAHPLTVQTAPFTAGLATHADPRAVAEPLGHRVSLEAPRGLVLDLVRPQTRSEGPELVTRQRPPRPALQRAATESAVADVEGPVSEPEPAPELASDSPPPRRHLPVTAEPRPAVQLMRVTAENQPRPLPTEQEIAAAAEPRLDAPALSEGVAEGAPEISAYPRLTLGQARRLGLGAPIARVPETATSVQRAVEAPVATPRTIEAPVATPRARAPEPPVPTDDAPPLQPFILDYLITKKAPPPAPTPISRRPRIQPLTTVARSAEPDQSDAPAVAAESNQAAAPDSDLVSTPPEPDLPAQRVAEPASPTPSASPEPWIQRTATAELAEERPLVGETSQKTSLLPPAATGETEGGSAAPLPALPLAAPHGPPSVQRLDQPIGGDPSEAEDAVESLSEPAGQTVAATEDEHVDGPVQPEPVAAILADRPRMATVEPPGWADHEARVVAPEPSDAIAGTLQQGAISAPTTPAAPTARISRASEVMTSPPTLQRAVESAPPIRPIATGPMLLRPERLSVGVPVDRPARAMGSTPAPIERSSNLTLPFTPPPVQRRTEAEVVLPLAHGAQTVAQAVPMLQRVTAVDSSTGNGHPPGTESPMPFDPAMFGSLPVASVQRTAPADWAVQGEVEAPAASSSVGVSAATAPMESSADENSRMEDLAGKLYDKIRVRLRNELLVDRERAGFLTDLR